MKGLKRARPVLVVCALAALSSTLPACKKDSAASGAAANAGARGRGRGAGMAFPVNVMPVEEKKVNYIVNAAGTLEAFERVQVTARVSGVVDKVAFSEGQNVKKGDVLVVIDSQRYQLAVNSAKAGLEKVLAAQADTEAMVARREGASAKHPGLIPGEELATYQTRTLTAKADTAAAKEALKIAELNLRDAFVRAPIDGTIQTRTVETGQYVNTGYLMATLLRADPLLLRFHVEPEHAPRLRPDMMVTFHLRESQEPYNAKITLVAGAADPATHTVPVTAEVDTTNRKYWLRPGTFGEVSIDVGARRDAPVIPRAATRATDRGYVVYVVEGNKAVEKVVALGMNTKDGWVEIRNGLKAGELLVVRGVESLTNGALVKATKVESMDAGSPEIPLVQDGGTATGSAAPLGSNGRVRKRPAGAKVP